MIVLAFASFALLVAAWFVLPSPGAAAAGPAVAERIGIEASSIEPEGDIVAA